MNAMNKPITPSPEQAAVIDAPIDEDALVVAGAGSGKTFTMTQRIIHLIERGVSPEKILGLTFTRKAASELLGRVSAAVAQSCASHEDQGNQESSVNRRRSAFLKPDVLTYDAFFQTIVRQYGLLVGFDQQTQPLSEAGAAQLASNVVDAHMDILFDHDFGAFSTVVRNVLSLSNEISGSMIGMHCVSVDDAITRIRRWDAAFEQQLSAAIGEQEIPEDKPSTAKLRQGKRERDEKYAQRRGEILEQGQQLCVYQCAQLRETVRQREILLTLVQDYDQEKRRLHMAEFSDFTIAAFQLVTRFPSIGERYRRRYSHVLLDEYQDTSTTQAALLATLFHADSQNATNASANGQNRTQDNGHAAPTSSSGSGISGIVDDRAMQPRYAFEPSSAVNAVGDPFQSIYAWRGASPGAFRLFQRDFNMDTAVKPYPLSVTRRNARLILQAANNLTAPLRSSFAPRRPSSSLMREVAVDQLEALPEAALGTVGLLGYDTLGQEIDGIVRFVKKSIQLHTPLSRALRSDETAIADNRLRNASGDIQTNDTDMSDEMANTADRIVDGGVVDNPVVHDPNRPHVAILFRSKAKMPLYEEALRQAGLSTMTVGYSAMLERPEVRDVLALLHVVSDHTDSTDLMRLLATPRYAVQADDLKALAQLASDLNIEFQFRALVQAGTVSPHAPRKQWAQLVKEHRDEVPNGVFLADMLSRDDIDRVLERSESLSASGKHAIHEASQAIQDVQRFFNHSLNRIVRTAVEALNLDIDTVVAQAINQEKDQSISPVLARAPMDAIAALIDTYTQEIAEDQNANLGGFISWIDSLSQIEDAAASMNMEPVDVVLMTIHQAKGLEWDSVAIVGMEKRSFPNDIGEGPKISVDSDHMGGWHENFWEPPQYVETAKTWLSKRDAVPVPVRSDAGILPRFPHDALTGSDPVEALQALDDAFVIDDEIFGDLRDVPVFTQDSDEMDRDHWYLTQSEEYGRRLHADERRLAYVALTRARSEILLTYHNEARSTRYVEGGITDSKEPKSSNFFDEIRDSLCHRDDIVTAKRHRSATGVSEGATIRNKSDGDAPHNAENNTEPDNMVILDGVMSDTVLSDTAVRTTTSTEKPPAPHTTTHERIQTGNGAYDNSSETLNHLEARRPDGFFVGDNAAEYERTVVEDAWNEPIEQTIDEETLPWPTGLSKSVSQTLQSSVLAVYHAQAVQRVQTERQTKPQETARPESESVTKNQPSSSDESLLERSQLLFADEDLMPWRLDGSADGERSLDTVTRRRGEHILTSRRQNVTSLQARSGSMNPREERSYWRGLVRPIPRVASPAAQAGTIFHDWAQRFVMSFDADMRGLDTDIDSDGLSAVATSATLETRASLLADLETGEQEDLQRSKNPQKGTVAQSAKEHSILTWQRRLAQSRWAQRRPLAAEQQIVVTLPELGDEIIVGKLDAIFYGGLNGEDSRFTIIDWKTGRKPRTSEDIETKLRQLDMYRLLLAAMQHVPLASIDATLYYLSEPDEGARELHAREKTAEEILAELNSGIPEQSDTD